MEGQYAGFRVERLEGHVALLTFSQPERLNGLHAAAKRDLVDFLTRFQLDDKSRVLVITGEGRAFCGGDDIAGPPSADQQGDGFSAYWREDRDAHVPPMVKTRGDGLHSYGSLRVLSQDVNRRIRALDKLTVAAVNGFAIQSGLSIALACDFRIAARGAKLGSGTLRFGYLPDEGGHWLLVQHMGVGRTMDFLMRNRIVPAEEAQQLGLVNEVVDADRLMPRALELARELADGPQVAMRLLKRSIYNAAELTFDQAGDDIASKTAVSDHASDAIEGRNAFREKRKARFNDGWP
jgi:2-(1,2-epoxy-1,2-dihydrophenyl)acetyl-CoA isomerase